MKAEILSRQTKIPTRILWNHLVRILELSADITRLHLTITMKVPVHFSKLHIFSLPVLRELGLIWMMGLLTGCGGYFSPHPQKSIDDGLKKAKSHYENRDYSGAIRTYEEILRSHPGYSDAHYQIALICDRNLNDFLSAIFHYQKYLDSPDMDQGKAQVVRGFMENAKLQFAASVPNSPSQNSPEIVKLRTENAALHRQIEEFKRDFVRTRAATKSKESSPGPAESQGAREVSSQNRSVAVPKPGVRPKIYTVKKGDGIQAIADRIYGDRRRWKDIMAANPSIKNPNQLKPGQTLHLP
jgi:tetratricopeptide (TPR) repeat protein